MSEIPDHTSIRFSEDERQIIAAILKENPHLQGKVARAITFALYHWKKETEMAKLDPIAMTSVRQYGGSGTGTKPMGSKPVDMRICAECGREYNALRGPCKHGKD